MEHKALKMAKGHTRTIFSPSRAVKRDKIFVKVNRELSNPDSASLNQGKKASKIKVRNKAIKRTKFKTLPGSQCLSNILSNRMKSVSPNRLKYNQFLSPNSIVKKNRAKYLSPMQRNSKFEALKKVQINTLKLRMPNKTSYRKEVFKKKYNLKGLNKLQKFNIIEESKKPSNSRISSTYKEIITSPSRHNASENRRYHHKPSVKTDNGSNIDVLKTQSFMQSKPNHLHQKSSGYQFEVYRSLSPEEGSFNILDEYLNSDTFDARLDSFFPQLGNKGT
ncbi:unnamed protein product [Moneuplotes crassus]|uniref:Uncharacterized protein n=1 Tax=Euplotes crassus TaxID=5936 RepID=A0AAD2DAV2_EUPCR|nr:unnamed protein product [Moneuplotes crassus]